MDVAFDSLHNVVPRVKVVGKLTIHAIDSVPVSVLVVLFFVCVALFQWPPSSSNSVLPTTHGDNQHPRLVALPTCRPGRFTYLNTFTRQLVISEKPLPVAPAPQRPRDRSGRLRQALRGYRPPLRCVPEDVEEAVGLSRS